MNHRYFCTHRKTIQRAHILSSSFAIELAQGNCAHYVMHTHFKFNDGNQSQLVETIFKSFLQLGQMIKIV